ncbi:MAG: DMT family transporter [Bacteroidota bacterium]|nr:DMT family transporter [Bacteroidota bacterium]
MNIGDLSALLTAFFWSITSLAFSYGVTKIGSMQVNINRLLFASVFLFFIIIFSGIPYCLSFMQIIYLIISGIIGLVLGDTFLFKSYENIGPRLSMLLMAATPAISTLLAFLFLGEGLKFWAVAGILVTACGLGLVLYQRAETPAVKYKINRAGIIYGLLAALGQALGLIFAKFAFQLGDISGFTAAFIRIFFSALILLPIGLATKKYFNPIKVFSQDKKALLSVLTGTIFGPVLGITFSLIAIQNTKVGIAATLMATSPIMMLPMVRYFFKERLTWQAILGAFIAVGGVAILFL